jgi:hypothetical protein
MSKSIAHRSVLALVLLLALGAPAARAFSGGSLLLVEPNAGIRQWTPGAPTAPLVIAGAPLSDPRGVAVDHAGNVLVADRVAGTFRYSPAGAFQTSLGLAAIDVTVAPSGAVYVLTDAGQVYQLDPPNQTLVASSIPSPLGIASTRDESGNDLVVVTTAASEILRVVPGPTTLLANGPIAQNIQRPGFDRFGNLLVPVAGHVYLFDTTYGIFLGSFGSSAILNPTDVAATDGDRYFIADGDAGGTCRILEIDPMLGGVTVAATSPICAHTPWSVAAVPGGTASPTLATGDLVLSDSGVFGGVGGIFRVNPTTGALRALRLGGPWVGGLPVQTGVLRVSPTRELYAHALRGVHRIDPGTGRATLVADFGSNAPLVGSAFLANGDLIFSVVDTNDSGHMQRLERATGDLSTYAPIDQNWWFFPGYPAKPGAVAIPYRAQIGATLQGLGALSVYIPGVPPNSGSALGYFEVAQPYPASGAQPWTNAVPMAYVTLDMAATPPDGGSLILATAPTNIDRSSADFTHLVVLTSGGMLSNITGIDVEESGNVVVADSNAFGGGGGVIRVNATTAVQTRVTTTTFVDPQGIAVVPPPACSDGVDNDGDGLVDYPADPGCLSPDDPWETVDCSDGIDNDGDGKVDFGPNGDPSCGSAQFGSEQTQCSDGADNDGDGKIDLDDPQCTSPTGNKESKPACGLLGIEVVGVAGWALARKARRRQRSMPRGREPRA